MRTAAALLLALVFAIPRALWAQTPPVPHYVQRVGERLPLDLPWTDEAGQNVTLRTVLGKKMPALIVFGYFKCPQLCSLVERGAVDSLRELGPSVGKDYDFIYLSIDPTDTAEDARGQRATSARAYGRADNLTGWHYLTGTPDSIRRTADAAGFQYRFDPASRQYAHPAGFLVISPDGTISRYFLGLDFQPGEIAAALRRARRGETGPTIFNLVLECFQGGRGASRKERLIWDGLWAAVALTVLAVGGGIGWMLWTEHRQGGHA